jgi:hypothetical protein
VRIGQASPSVRSRFHHVRTSLRLH